MSTVHSSCDNISCSTFLIPTDPDIRRSSRRPKTPTKYWLNDLPPLSPIVVYFTERGEKAEKKPKAKKAKAGLGSDFVSELMAGSVVSSKSITELHGSDVSEKNIGES